MLQVKCNCSHEFCFKCNLPPHLPATCNMISDWNETREKLGDTLDSLRTALKNFIKRCPKCNKPVEKTGVSHLAI
jgi:ariadne-1